MPKSKESNFSDYFKIPNPGLRSYFGIVRSGQPEIYRAPFANKQDPQKVLKDWDKILSSIRTKYPSLYEFEKDLGSKVGPMSVMKPLAERIKDIDHYYEDVLLKSEPISERALKAVVSEFKGLKGLSVRSQSKTVDIMKKSTNSGSPYFTKRKAVVDKTVPCKVSSTQDGCLQELNDGTWKGCAVLGWRGQEGGPKPEDTKQRVVWMFPFAVNIQELQVYQPLIETAQKFNYVPAWVSMESVDAEITKMFDTKAPNDLVMCTDFSKFDQHFNSDMQDGAKYILSHLMDHTGREWLEEIFPIKYDIPLAYDYGKIRYGKHGMGSGSGGTNADETLSHRALQYEAAQSINSRLNPHSQCLGDDGVLTFPGLTEDVVMRSYTAHGQDMNKDKQYVSTHDCVYLRRWHDKDYRQNNICVGVYSTNRALGRLMEQERFYDPEKWNNKLVALRQLSILENCKYHPLKEQFVEFCIKRDKFRLGLDIPGFLDNIESEAKKAMDEMPDFLGYTKSIQKKYNEDGSGIKDWWIVKYLKSMR
nr:MAG: RNA-dependent RNA polymerase [Porcine picobirnavirus]